MDTVVRVRVIFEEDEMLSNAKKKEGLNRCWVLLKPKEHCTVSHFSSHLYSTFNLNRTCPYGIILSMEGFVLPPFESTYILKDKDIVCVQRKGSISTDDNPALLPCAHNGGAIDLPKLLAIEGFQGEDGQSQTVLQEDESDELEEDAVNVESNANSEKRKASKKSKSPSKKKIKLSSTEKLAVIPKEEVENESFEGRIHHRSVVKKDNDKSSNLSSQPNKSSILDRKQNKNSSGSRGDKTRPFRLQDGDGTETKKMPSRSTRRKKAKRRWLKEQKLQQENQKPHPSLVVQKDGQQLPIKDNNVVVSDAHQQTDVESEAEDDIVPMEIRPGHIRFEPHRKDQEVQQNHFPVEMFRPNETTSRKGQKWGTEKISSHKQVDYEDGIQDSPDVHHAEKQHTLIPVDFDKLTPYTSSPKHGKPDSTTMIAPSGAWDNLVKATNISIDEKLAGDRLLWGIPSKKVKVSPLRKVNGKVNGWDELYEALAAKKAKLSKDDGWSHASSDSRSWSDRAFRCSAPVQQWHV